jgi:hypothetical protein
VSWEIAVILSLGSALGSLWLARTVILRLPADYFVGEPTRSKSGRLAWVGRNVAGFLLIVLGLVLSIPGVPGQGVLTMAIGLIILDVPGKHALERRFIGHPRVLAALNKIRDRAGCAPFAEPERSVHAADGT